jgi:WD40 repeat protein
MTDVLTGAARPHRPSCPDSGRLSALLAERLPAEDEAHLQAHLEGCRPCQETLEGLVTEDDSWVDLARHLGPVGAGADGWDLADTGPALRGVLAGLRDLDPRELAARSDADAAADPGPSLNALTPSETPGSLGRLGSFEVLGVVGRGGMGVVLRAQDPTLRRVVALKVLAPHLAGRPPARERFLREARLSAAVAHENVVPLYAVVESAEVPFLVMQYVEGVSLQQRLDVGARFTPAEVAGIGLQIARGLAAAHARGVIHRDVKPGNVLLEAADPGAGGAGPPAVKITDFGLARAVDETCCTESGVTLGTPAYMSPEQAEGRPLDCRSDLFSLGSVLYALCTGKPPFPGDQPLAVLRRVCDERPVPVRDLNPDVPAWLAGLIERLHARDPGDRPESAAAVAAFLERGLAHLQGPRHVPPPTAGAARPPRRRGRWLVAACLLLAAGLGASEAAGFTHLLGQLGTVLRFRTDEGTLVVEVDDPQVKVQLDGRDLVISGAGAQEFRLKTGSYKLTATKGGRLVKEEIISLARDGRRTVRIFLEPAPAARPGLGPTMPKTAVSVPRLGPALAGPPPEPLRVLRGHRGPVHGLAVSPDGRYVFSSSGWPQGDGTIRKWDLISGKEVRAWSAGCENVNDLALSPDGRRLLSGGADGIARVWDAETGKELAHFGGHVRSVMAVAWSPDGKVAASGSQDRSVRAWDAATGKELAVCLGHTDFVHGVAFSPDGRRLLSGSRDKTIRLWDAAEGQQVRAVHVGRDWVNSVAFLKDGKHALAGELVASVWDLETGKEVRRYKAPGGPVIRAALSPDGRYVLTGGYDWAVRLFDFRTGRWLRTLGDQKGIVWAVAFTPDGRFCLSGGGGLRVGNGERSTWAPGSDHAIRLWDLGAVVPVAGVP